MEKFKTSWALHKNSFDSLAVLDQKVKQENSKISWAYFIKRQKTTLLIH